MKLPKVVSVFRLLVECSSVGLLVMCMLLFDQWLPAADSMTGAVKHYGWKHDPC